MAMHTNPFTGTGQDLRDLESKIASLECTIGELRSEITSLRCRCEVLEESGREMIEEWKRANSQFGVDA